MKTLTIRIDAQTESGLRHIVGQHGDDVTEVATRLLARAVQIGRPRVRFDPEAIRVANAAYVEEDDVLAESARAERAALLAREDNE